VPVHSPEEEVEVLAHDFVQLLTEMNIGDGVFGVPPGSPGEEVEVLAHDFVQLLTEQGIDWAREWGS
jgi:hypothetical protein